MIDEGHATPGRLFTNDRGRRALGANKQHLALVRRQLVHIGQRIVQRRHGVLKIDDMDFVAGTEDVLSHLGIPETGLVTEMCACLQQFAHGDLCHEKLQYGLGLHMSRLPTLLSRKAPRQP